MDIDVKNDKPVKTTKKRGLTVKQKRFVENILTSDNQTQAAIKAGYKPESARITASENLTKDNIKSEINKRTAEIEAKTDITLQEVIENARYLINLGKEKQNGTDISNGNKQLGEMIAAFKQAIINEDKPKQLNSSEIEGLEQIASEYVRKQAIKIG